MATEPADFAKTPEEIYSLPDRADQVLEAARLLEYALREYSGELHPGFTELYNSNRQVFDKPLRDELKQAFQTRRQLRNPDRHSALPPRDLAEATSTFIKAAEDLINRHRHLFPDRFWPRQDHLPDSDFIEQGFDSPPGNPSTSTFQQARSASFSRERSDIRPQEARREPDREPDESGVGPEYNSDDHEPFTLPRYKLPEGNVALFPPKIKVGEFEKLCNRIGRSLKAGLSIVSVWENESRSRKGAIAEAFREVLREISSGETLANAVAKHECFPPIFVEMVRVGEETGRLDRAFLRLSEHFRHLQQMRRTFIAGITWPLFQLFAAIGVVTLFFIVLAVLESMITLFKAPDIFMLGFGPIGNLILFWILLAIGGTGLFILIKGTSAGWFGELPMKLALRIPLVGNTIKTLCLSRFAWSFGMAIEAGMDAQRAIRLGVRSTDNFFYTAHEEEIAQSVAAGNDFYSSLQRTGAFPDDLLQAVDVGEVTGEITESLERLSDDYREQAEIALKRISQIGAFLVSMFTAGIIILLVVLMYMNYLGTLYDAVSDSSNPLQQIERGEKSSNPVTAARNDLVKKIMEREDMKKITGTYEALGKADELHGHKLLDAIIDSLEGKQ